MVTPRTVVIGAGPAGLAAAYILHEQGSAVTLVEKTPDPSAADPSRAFSYLVTQRGMPAIDRMGLDETLADVGTSGDTMKITVYAHNQEPRRLKIAPFSKMKRIVPRSFWLSRAKLVRIMLDRVKSCPGIDVRLGQPVKHLEFSKDGARVFIEGHDTPLEAELVIGGDGFHSTVRTALHRGKVGELESTSGFNVTKHYSAAVGLPYKTIVVGSSPLIPVVQEDGGWKGEPARPNESYTFRGALKGEDSVRLGLLPVGNDPSIPRTGTIVVPANRTIWKVRTAEEAYDLFQRNFPFINVRELIPKNEMERFAAAETGHFPPIQRSNSLVGTCGDAIGVCLVGDAAHAMPPDLGLGVNSALEDVVILARMLEQNDTLSAALRAYEDDRSDDVDALMRLMQLGSPYQYRQNMFRYYLTFTNQLLRGILHRAAPQWFHPQIFLMVSNGRFRDVLRRADVTTQRIYALATALVVIASAATAALTRI